MWFSFIPILAMGVFLMVIWNMISPIRFIQQLKKERAEKTNGRPIHIREFNPDDTAETAQIFFDAVRIGTVLYYNQSQREAWAPKLPNHEQWCQKLSMQEVFVAEDNAGLIGFMSLNNDGCIDLAFVKPAKLDNGLPGTALGQSPGAAKAERLGGSPASCQTAAVGLMRPALSAPVHANQSPSQYLDCD